MLNKVIFPWVMKNIEEQGAFKGYASVFNTLDDHGDRVVPGAFHKTLEQWKSLGSAPKMLWQHNQDEPIGWWKDIREDEYGLYVEGQLLLSVSKGREVYEMLKNHMIDKLSIGCRIVEAERGEKPAERLLKSLDLYEISLVTFAANAEANITLIKNQSSSSCSWELLASLNNAHHILQHAFIKR